MKPFRCQWLAFLLLLTLPSLPLLANPLFDQEVAKLLPKNQERFAQLPSGETLYGKYFIRRMYEEKGGGPIWTPEAITALAKALKTLSGDGLNPDDYRFDAILPLLNNPELKANSIHQAVTWDLLLSEAYLRGMYNLYYGKTDPQRLDPNNNFAQARDGKDRSALLLLWIKHAGIEEAFNWARPKNPRYHWMRRALKHYLKIQANGGWPQIPPGPDVEPGGSDPRLLLVRRRLAITGDLASAKGDMKMDDRLLEGILRFQQRHYLTETGALDADTITAMNVPVADRIAQIRVNLERQRWLFPVMAEEYLVVDIAGFTIFWFKDQEIVWQDQVQVGEQFTQTPIFKDNLRFVELNPDWKATHGQESLQGGAVRFLFPNPHGVYLHDADFMEMLVSPNRTTTSDGCIRLQNPLDLADQLLAREGWSAERVDKAVQSGKPHKVALKHPIPILIHYSTAWATEDDISFKPDVYHRDPGLLTALDGPFVFHQPDLEREPPKIRYQPLPTESFLNF